MAPKPKVGAPKKRPAKAATKEKPQRERFIEAVRERGVTNEDFERLFGEVVPPNPRAKGKVRD